MMFHSSTCVSYSFLIHCLSLVLLIITYIGTIYKYSLKEPLGLLCSVELLCPFSAVPVTFTTPLYDITIPENEDVVFKCETTKPDKVQWLKNGKKITKPSKRISIIDEGIAHSLAIEKAQKEDEADYTAKIGDESTTGKLTVTSKIARHKSFYTGLKSKHRVLPIVLLDDNGIHLVIMVPKIGNLKCMFCSGCLILITSSFEIRIC